MFPAILDFQQKTNKKIENGRGAERIFILSLSDLLVFSSGENREARLRGGTITSVPLPLKEMWLWDWHFYNLWSQHVRGDDSREKCQSLGPGACL